MQSMQIDGCNCTELLPTDDGSVQKEEKVRKTPEQKYGRLLGGLHINYLMYFFIPLLIFACVYCYHEAVKKKDERPFPHATITNTACHYSQDIVFRGLMLPAGSFIVLIYFTAFQYLKLEKRRTDYPEGTNQWLKNWALASVVGFYCAIGTIDGAGYPDLHSFGAVFFFIVLFVTAGAITLVMKDMRDWDSRLFSRKSILVKIVVVGYILGVAIYCLVGAVAKGEPENDDDIHVVIIEWNLTLGGLVWLLTFVLDWQDVFVTLRGDFGKTIKLI